MKVFHSILFYLEVEQGSLRMAVISLKDNLSPYLQHGFIKTEGNVVH